MTVEQVKRKLHSVRNLKVRLMALQQRIDELAEEIDGISAVDYGKVKVKSSKSNSVENRYIKRVDRLNNLRAEYDSIFNELSAVEDELGERMKRLNPTEYKIIYERFIHGIYPVSIQKMAQRLGNGKGCGVDMVKKAQQRAFRKMADEPPISQKKVLKN